MARKRMNSKIQPAVLSMHFVTPTVTLNQSGTFFIDLSQCASLLNRRFYRQGLNWAVADIKITSQSGGLSLQKLPNTWVMSNAWEKSFRAWQKMIKNATDESGSVSVKPKFLDFKIFADKNHHQAGFSQNLLPQSFDAVTATVYTAERGEWVPCHIELSDPSTPSNTFTQFDLIAVGPNDPGVGATGNNAKSIIQGYADSRALPSSFNDPNVPADAPDNWMVNLFGEGTDQDEEVIAELIASNNQAPYPYENGIDPDTGLPFSDTMYPGGETQLPTLETHEVHQVTSTTIGGMTHLKGGNFPCGLMAFTWSPTEQTSGIRIQIDLVPGTHRGYLCEPMTEM